MSHGYYLQFGFLIKDLSLALIVEKCDSNATESRTVVSHHSSSRPATLKNKIVLQYNSLQDN
jgi:hypothetical protein